ncbi:ABC transporter ATP-binding protein [Desulfurococcaceae archaeon AG1]|nr:ABC transporter ATP-binding protein [Desulfurococcaceae archaeon AG1]
MGEKGKEHVILKAVGITKRFGSIIANDNISIELYKSEIHGLLGENGSGKTTLCRIIYGQLKPDSGKIYIDGVETKFNSPRDAIRAGIAMVHQELSLIPTLTVSENVALAKMNSFKIPREKIYEEILELGERFGIKVPPDVPISRLSYGERQRVEILKALSLGARILIMDEPTTYLTNIESEDLFKSLKNMVSEGLTILFVSHRINEILSITDRVTILRAGKVVGSGITKELSKEKLVEMIVGNRIAEKTPASSEETSTSEVAISIRDLYVMGDVGQMSVNGVNLDLYYGEVLGIAGVEGNGQRELVEAIVGLRRPLRGSVRINNVDVSGFTTRKIRELGVAYVPEDPGAALVLDYPIFRNLIISPIVTNMYLKGKILLDINRVKEAIKTLIKIYSMRVEKPEQITSTLSGGTKQKLVVGRELHVEPKILILYNPSKGLDVATSEHLKQIIINEKKKGKAVLLYSADLDELVEMSDRIAVMYSGRIVALFRKNDEDLLYRIAHAMTTGQDPGARREQLDRSTAFK